MIPVSVTYQVNGQPSMSMWVDFLHVLLTLISLFIQGTDDPACDWRALMVLDRKRKYASHKIYGMAGNFWAALDGIKVSTCALHTVSEPYENS